MPDDPSSGHRPPVPGVVDVVSVETVEPLVTRHEEELAALRLELEEALREAEAAEQRLNRHPAASVFDDAFEADILAHVAGILPTAKGLGNPVGTAHTVDGPPTVALGDGGPQVSTDSHSALAVDPPQPQPGPKAPAVPRTVVVNRGAPRTVVVDRSRPPSSSPPPAPPGGTAVRAGDPGAAQFVSSQANAEGPAGRRRRGRKDKGHLLARLPAGVLIQAGVVVVIVALLLLKLA